MKSNWAVLLSTLLLVTIVSIARGATAPSSTRTSADGVELPAAVSERKFHATVPYASVILGERPEEVGRVFNARKSAALLAKHSAEDLGCDWFVLNADGANVVGLRLTDGQVSKAVLFYEAVTQARVENVRKQFAAHPDRAVKVDVKPIAGDGKKLSLALTFEVEPLEFYLATHSVDAKIAAALRQRTWVEGMTDEQATIVGDGPGKYAATYAADAPTGSSNVGTGTIFADGGAASNDLTIIIEARNKHEAREEALKRHKNFKDIARISDIDAKAAAKK
jgi:hypothetical protein